MSKININAGLKTPCWVQGYCSSFNGCSGTSWRLASSSIRPSDGGYYGCGFDRKVEINFWDLLISSASKKLMVLYPPIGARLPSPNVWFKPPKNFEAYYLKSDDDVLAVLGGKGFEHFDDPKSPPAIFLAEPEKYASLAHLEQNGMFHRSQVVATPGKKQRSNKLEARRNGGNQVYLCNDGAYPPDIGDFAKAWSNEVHWLRGLPWWEKYRLGDVPYPSAEECVEATANCFFDGSGSLSSYNGLAHTSGNAAAHTPYDSIRNVFCFHSLNPEATLRLDSTPVVTSPRHRKALYYKILPFYFHSPLHDNHRVAACFLSDRPIHLEKI